MKAQRLTWTQWIGIGGFALVLLISAAAIGWRTDILRYRLDPRVPFPAYEPPPAPDYAKRSSWALFEAEGIGSAPVFFVHPTTYDGGRHWNAPLNEPRARAWLDRVVLPNHAAPFAKAGPVSAPLYRHASLYTRLTLREDARDARAFAYADIERAFATWLARHPEGPVIIAGVEQGAELAARLVQRQIEPEEALARRVAAIYLIDAVIPRDASGLPPPCATRQMTGCVVAFTAVEEGKEGDVRQRLARALFWNERGRLTELGGRQPICINPVVGRASEERVPARRHHGATNATGLEWGLRPALISHEIATRCQDGVLRYTAPRQESFGPADGWANRRKVQPFNLFYADLELDMQTRLAAFARQSSPARSARQSNSASST